MIRFPALGLLLGICACGIAAATKTGAEPSCVSTSECSAGQVCSEGSCTFPDLGLAIHITPLTSSGLVQQDFNSVNVDTGTVALQLDAPPYFEFSSTQLGTMGQPGTPLTCTVELSGQSIFIPTITYPGLTVGLAGGTESNLVNFDTPAGIYQIIATPTDDPAIPPVEIPMEQLTSGGVPVPLTFANPASLVTLQGRLVGSSILQQAPPPSYLVQAFSTSTPPIPLSQATAAGGPDAGYSFSVSLGPSAGGQIVLVATPAAGGGVGPVVTLPPASLADIQSGLSDGGMSLGSSAPVTVSGSVFDASGAPLVGATVYLRAGSLPGGQEFQSAGALTDGDGDFQAQVLYQGGQDGGDLYVAEVVPAAGSGADAAVTQGVAIFMNDSLTLAPITAATLVQVTGTVVDPSGKPVAGSKVTATPSPCSPSSTINTAVCSLPLSPPPATTAADGTFTIDLTPGIYQFIFSPPNSQVLSQTGRGPILIQGGFAFGSVQLSSAKIVTGTVTGPTGSPLQGGELSVYLISQGDNPSNPSQMIEVVVQLTSTVIGNDGSFSVVVPSTQ